jgi:N-acyl-D-amino-acid deacylase
MKLDLVLKNGKIYDGLGSVPVFGHIGIAGDRLVFPVKDQEINNSVQVIDISGLAVSPGFINIHSHSDEALLLDGRVPSSLLQGITTEVIGNCGSSLAPLSGESLEELQRSFRKEYDMDVTWNDFEGLFDLFEKQGVSVNVISLAGHGTLRGSVVGMKDRLPDEAEMQQMKESLAESMKQGAFGISTGLIYPPGSFSDTSELIELAKTAALYGGIYASHIRGEGNTLLDAINEAITIGRTAGIPVEISHLKAAGEKNWGKTADALAMIRKARNEGLFIQHDQYPYTCSSTGLAMVIPDWVHDGGTSAMIEKMKNCENRKRIRAEMLGNPNFCSDRIVISSLLNPDNKKYEGRVVSHCAAEEEKDACEFIIDLLVDEEIGGGAIYASMHEDDVRRVMLDTYTAIGNDAGARSVEGLLSSGKPHPRCFGTFPRVLGHYSRKEKLFSMEEAIRKMTSLPAGILGIRDRGVIRTGNFADLVVFDPEAVMDKSEYSDPHRYPEGIKHVIVNGVMVTSGHEIFPVSPGRVLRNQEIYVRKNLQDLNIKNRIRNE